MTTYEILKKLKEDGTLAVLYRDGFINIRCYTQVDVFEYYKALRVMPKYMDRNAEAVRATAQEFEVSVRSVYEAVRVMSKLALEV